jgi:glycosyltransferase involved in cell wall biosynthesis
MVPPPSSLHGSSGPIGCEADPTSPRGTVAVIIPVRNRPALIMRALDSVDNQTRLPECVIVVDDGSSDDTVASIRQWQQAHALPLDVLAQPHNQGPAAARNLAMRHADTDYIALLDSDDEYLPSALAAMGGALDACPGAVMVFGDADTRTPTGDVAGDFFTGFLDPVKDLVETGPAAAAPHTASYRLRDAHANLLLASFIFPSATCFRREVAVDAGGMPEHLRYGEDWILWLRLAERGELIALRQVLALHYRHEGNITGHDHAAGNLGDKLAGLTGLLQGELGIPLRPDDAALLRAEISRINRQWRYQASRAGLKAYWRALGRLPLQCGSRLQQVLRDPKALLRAAYRSLLPEKASPG